MATLFAQKLAVGGKKNTLGLTEEVVQTVLQDPARLEELYQCLFDADAWIRMRAADGLEKVCRLRPEWFESYIDRLFSDIGESTQASIQWHLAQILGEVKLTPAQERATIKWLKQLLKTVDIDWIAAANAMATLADFAKRGILPAKEATHFLKLQQRHASPAVRKRAQKLLQELS